MTPLPLTCSIVWILLSDHFNRLLGYRFSWVCRMRDEAGSWGGVLKNNTKCSISFLQSRETADKLRHTREENTHKNTHTMQYDTYIQINYLSAPLDPHQPHDLTPIFPLSLFLQSKSIFFFTLTDKPRHIAIGNHVLDKSFIIHTPYPTFSLQDQAKERNIFNIYSNICGGQQKTF